VVDKLNLKSTFDYKMSQDKAEENTRTGDQYSNDQYSSEQKNAILSALLNAAFQQNRQPEDKNNRNDDSEHEEDSEFDSDEENSEETESEEELDVIFKLLEVHETVCGTVQSYINRKYGKDNRDRE